MSRTSLVKDIHSMCKEGSYGDLKKLLAENENVDIYKPDDCGLSPLEHAINNNHLHCAGLITEEAHRRTKIEKHPYRKYLQKQVEQDMVQSFDVDFFRQLVENDVELAYSYLNKFKEVEKGYKFKFNNLQDVYGTSTKTCALAVVLNDPVLPSRKDEILNLLEHPVLQRVLQIKWELFAARKYCQNLLLYILMLMAMTNDILLQDDRKRLDNQLSKSESNDANALKDLLGKQYNFAFWVFTFVFCMVGFYFVEYLKPKYFSKLTHWQCTGKYENGNTPMANEFKIQARWWLFYCTLHVALLVAIPLLIWLKYGLSDEMARTAYNLIEKNTFFTSLVLWLCTIVFLYSEMSRLVRVDPWFYQKDKGWFYHTAQTLFLLIFFPILVFWKLWIRKHCTSLIEIFYLFTPYVILGPYSYLSYVDRSVNQYYLYSLCGVYCTISLWLLALRYLQVFKTPGSLLPILFDVVGDVCDYIFFYAVFQFGLTCAFYFLFQQRVEGYSTFWSSFTSTYFVLYGSNDVDGLSAFTLRYDSLPVGIETCGTILRMFNSGVMVVLLLNLLIATMNKTVNRNWKNLHVRALTSYARTIIRIEANFNQDDIYREKIIDSNPWSKVFGEEILIKDSKIFDFEGLNPPNSHKELEDNMNILKYKNSVVLKTLKLLNETTKQNIHSTK